MFVELLKPPQFWTNDLAAISSPRSPVMESFEAAVEPSPSHSERLGHGDLRKLGFYEETGVYGTASIKFHPKVTELSQLPHVWAGEVAGWRSQERERERDIVS